MKYLDGYACVFGSQRLCFESSLTPSDWAAWVQAIGSIVAILVAVALPLWLARRARLKSLRGCLETIAMDVRLTGRQAAVYIKAKIPVPAYRMPNYGGKQALPALMADGTLSIDDSIALGQFYLDATSFNYCLDLAQGIKTNLDGMAMGSVEWIARTGQLASAVRLVEIKASHLVPESTTSRYEQAIAVLRKHLPPESLRRLDVEIPGRDGPGGKGDFLSGA